MKMRMRSPVFCARDFRRPNETQCRPNITLNHSLPRSIHIPNRYPQTIKRHVLDRQREMQPTAFRKINDLNTFHEPHNPHERPSPLAHRTIPASAEPGRLKPKDDLPRTQIRAKRELQPSATLDHTSRQASEDLLARHPVKPRHPVGLPPVNVPRSIRPTHIRE